MNALQRNLNRATARQLAEDVFEARLPSGLSLRRGALHYECPSCGGDSEWYGTPEQFDDPEVSKKCGGSEWCIP